MTDYKKRLLIVFLAVFVANMFVFATGGTTMADEPATSVMTGMNGSNCDNYESGNVSCDICVISCVTSIGNFIDIGAISPDSALTQHKLENQPPYISHVSFLDPFPPRPLYLA